jgi:hypothetical protein
MQPPTDFFKDFCNRLQLIVTLEAGVVAKKPSRIYQSDNEGLDCADAADYMPFPVILYRGSPAITGSK